MNYSQQIVIENVLQYKMRGKVAYLGTISSTIASNLIYVKPFDHPSGKGYQRPVEKKRVMDFSQYLSYGNNALFTPILINGESKWTFSPYDRLRPSYGRLLCQDKASLMDGQHRLGGIKNYTKETQSEISIPFLAFHYLDDDEEIQLFDTINTKAKGIGTSLSKYLKRDSDELSWIATELILRNDSPFHSIGTLTGKRKRGRHVTLQNIYRFTENLIENTLKLSKEAKLLAVLIYFNAIKEKFSDEWSNYNEYRLSHIVCLTALSLAGAEIFKRCITKDGNSINYKKMKDIIDKLDDFDWSSTGNLKYLKGLNGSKALSSDLINIIL